MNVLGRAVLLLLIALSARADTPLAALGADELTAQPAFQGWTTQESARLRLHLPPGTTLRDPAAFLDAEEAILTRLLGFFGGPLSGKVDFFVWNGDADAQAVLGRPLAFAIPDRRTIHTSTAHSPGHELTHVVVGDGLRPTSRSRFVEEGTAVAFDQTGRDLVVEARRAVSAATNKPSTLAIWALEERSTPDELLYPLAGAFVQRLLAVGGKDRLLALLRDPSLDHARTIYADLDRIVAAFDADVGIDPDRERLVPLRLRARVRMAAERERFSAEELREIEALYGKGSMKTPEGLAAYRELVERFPTANRAGCAALYLARTAKGADKTAALERAIRDFDDTWYGDGTQVGPYARALLAIERKKAGDLDGARQLAAEIAAKTPDAVEHTGRRLLEILQGEGIVPP